MDASSFKLYSHGMGSNSESLVKLEETRVISLKPPVVFNRSHLIVDDNCTNEKLIRDEKCIKFLLEIECKIY